MTDQNLLLQENGYPNAPADIKQVLREQANGLCDGTLSHFDDAYDALIDSASHIEQLERELAAKDQRIVELSEQLDTERVRLAACGVAAMANTRESMGERITRDNPYWSESYGDVCKAVDKQVAYREQLEEARKDALRWNWLRDISNADEAEKIVGRFIGCDLDTVVDAAMKDKP